MRKFAIIIVVLLVAAVGLLLALPHIIDINRYRGQVQSELQKRLNRPVQLGQLSLSILPLRVEASNVVIGDDPSVHSDAPFAQVAQLDLSLNFFLLFRDKVEIDRLDMQRPRIELVRNAQGVWNFSTVAGAPAAPPAPSQPRQPGKPAAAPSQRASFAFRELRVSDGQIAITDHQKRQPRAIYDHIDVTLKDYVSGQPFSFDLMARLPGNGSQTFRVTGSAGPVNPADLAGTPFKGTLRLDEVSLSAVREFLNSSALENTDAVISGSTDLSNSGGKMSAAGSLKLNHAVIHGVAVGYAVAAGFDLTDDLADEVIQIRKGALQLGSTPMSVSGTINTRPKPFDVDVDVSASNVSIEDAARLSAAFGTAFSPDAKITGKLSLNVHAQGLLDHLVYTGNVKGENLEITGKQIQQAVRVPSIDLTMTPQQIQSNHFTATSGATSLTMQMTLAHYASVAPNIDASLKTVNGRVNELLNIAKAFGVAEGMSGSGNVTLDLHATGPIKSANAMKFSGSGALQNVSLKMPSLTQPVNVHIANLQFSQNSVKVTNLSASLGSTSASGKLRMTNFQAPHLTFALAIDKLNVTELEQIISGSTPHKALTRKRADNSWSLVPTADASPAKAARPGILQSATGNGTITVSALTYQQTVLTNVRSNVALNRGLIQLNPFVAQIFDGQETGSVTVDTRPNPMTYGANIRLTNVDANQMLSAFSSVKDKLYGTLCATMNLTFATPPSGDIAQTLNGTMTMDLANGKIMKLDLPGELSKIGKFGGVTPKGYTAISQMSSTFNIHGGVAQTNDLKAALDIGTMAADGSINLSSQDLNMHVTAVLNKSFSQAVGGTSIGGYLNTVLANKDGELVLPVLITGNMNHPLVAPDVQQIARMKLNHLGNALEQLLGGSKKR